MNNNNITMKQLTEEYRNKMEEVVKEYEEKAKKLLEVDKGIKDYPSIEEGQGYFYIDEEGNIYFDDWANHPVDQQRLEYGNCYPCTEENKEQVEKQVELIAERRRLQNQMEMFARQNNEGKIDWNNDEQMKWSLCVEHNETIVIDYGYYYRQLNTVYFTSQELAEEALEKFGDEIKRLYIDK